MADPVAYYEGEDAGEEVARRLAAMLAVMQSRRAGQDENRMSGELGAGAERINALLPVALSGRNAVLAQRQKLADLDRMMADAQR
jgi:hypothetical protein